MGNRGGGSSDSVERERIRGSPDRSHGLVPAAGGIPDDLVVIVGGPARVPGAHGADTNNDGPAGRPSDSNDATMRSVVIPALL